MAWLYMVFPPCRPRWMKIIRGIKMAMMRTTAARTSWVVGSCLKIKRLTSLPKLSILVGINTPTIAPRAPNIILQYPPMNIKLNKQAKRKVRHRNTSTRCFLVNSPISFTVKPSFLSSIEMPISI